MIINNIIFNTELGDILSELQSQLNANGIQLLQHIKNTPDNIMVSCPYHKGGQENRPSAGLRKSDGQFHCLACGETHSLQEMISFCFGHLDDHIGAFGWNWLLKNFLTVSVEERKDVELDFARNNRAIPPVRNIDDIQSGGIHSGDNNIYNGVDYIPEDTLDSYRYYHPYMYKRKLTNEVIELFDIGYDKTTRCITFPIRDISGHTLFVARRSVDTKYFNYPSGAEKPVYGLYEISKTQTYPTEIIICESMLDALTCWVYGKYAVALNGLGNELQFKQLNKMHCRKFILATDMDSAGLNARNRIKRNIKNKLVTEYTWDINIAKDINDMTQEYFDNLKETF